MLSFENTQKEENSLLLSHILSFSFLSLVLILDRDSISSTSVVVYFFDRVQTMVQFIKVEAWCSACY